MKKIIQVVTLGRGGNSRISLCSVGQPAKDSASEWYDAINMQAQSCLPCSGWRATRVI